MSFDFKREFHEIYQPSRHPHLIQVSSAQYIAISSCGDPNEEGSAYKQAISALYAMAYTIKMSKMGAARLNGYFDFVVPPLEGLWHHKNDVPINFTDKSGFEWTSMIRMPDFVTEEILTWARQEAWQKKQINCSDVSLLQIEEGLCVQLLHIGSYDDEPLSIRKMADYILSQGCRFDYGPSRLHHEIYLSDPRRTAPERLKTIIRLPVAKTLTQDETEILLDS